MNSWVERLIAQMASHYDNAIVSLAQQVTALLMMVQTQQALVFSYKRQVDALPASAGGGHSRQPKIGEPPSFRGSDNKTKLDEWLNLIVLWCEHEGVATDKQHIVTALSKLQGPAHQYMMSYYIRMCKGKDLGTWKDFVDELAQIYGQRDDKKGAKKKITALFTNKDLASKDFIKYAERFRTLGQLTGYDNGLLTNKLREVLPRDMRLVLAGKDKSVLPTEWTKFLDVLLNINKIINPEKSRGTIFSKGGSDDHQTPMDIDSAEKSKGKGKNKDKQVATATANKKKFCYIYKKTSHNTDDCYQLAKNSDKKPKAKYQSMGHDNWAGGNGSQASRNFKAKKMHVIEVEITDDEGETPQPSTSVLSARIEELEDADETALVGKDEAQSRSDKVQPRTTSDF
ncbi:hypothetical protein PHLCEN_2v1130 [Hermanssonia centrifuga]|uniref:Ty3 transposon capsid-like protein domain-containing protein n=1 Tax=Hermanssonia centrifuga TaxID=98765 RepID=A0A2R6S447_9APHY|nr:hypothetical protein PHLCEN_2v1130 [Hermanssonia centrifuga]